MNKDGMISSIRVQKYGFLSVFLTMNPKNEEMILVTGATGLVGGNLLWYLLQENDHVVALRRTSSKINSLRTIFSFYTSNPDEFLSRVEWRTADILNKSLLQAVMQNITEIYHCAAAVSLGDATENLLNTNVKGTRNIVQAALNAHVRRFCFVSSIAACGKETGNKLVDENSPWIENPNRSIYAQSKYLSEQEVWKGIKAGLNAVIVNPGVILGVSGTDKGSSQLFAQIQKGLPFYTSGGSGYVDVQDVAKIMIQLTKSDISNERFIVVSENYSNKDLLNRIADRFGTSHPVIRIGRKTMLLFGLMAGFMGKIFHFQPIIDKSTARSVTHSEFYSNQKIREAIGFKFNPIEKSVKEICRFLKNQRKMEINEKMEIREIAYQSDAYIKELKLRDKVLRKPLGMSLYNENLEKEVSDIHLGSFIDGQLVGVLILTPLIHPDIKMRQVAVDKSFRSQKVGSRLVGYAEQYALTSGYTRMVLNARATAVTFYETLGYHVISNEFTEVGIPHFKMTKNIE
jgi:nucleoside-diphosphate-sugar epimerase/predicted GNAT family N-acyltransferase